MGEDILPEALTAYLAEHFEHVKISGTAPFDRDGHGVTFRIQAEGGEYRLNILDTVIAGLDRAAIIALLGDNRVASVMRDLSGFPVTLTDSGCIFGDL